jgi:two-component system, cell cycle sensor histidine kinase and response regulator CckA
MKFFSRWSIATIILLAVLLPAGSFWYYHTRLEYTINEVNANLEAIAQLKINQINDWRKVRLSEATVIMGNQGFSALAARCPSGLSKFEVDQFDEGFKYAQQSYHYSDVLIATPDGQVCLQLNKSSGIPHETLRKNLNEAFSTQKALLKDLYIPPGKTKPVLDMISPFFIQKGKSSVPNGAMVFQYEADLFLYPALAKWPVPSRSAETLLIRRDGDSALYLNELRFQQGAALNLRIPIDRKDVTAVKAVLGDRGPVRGKDYRGTRVLAVIKAVPDTDWLMIAKIDEDEAFASLKRESVFMLAMVLFLMASAFTAMGVMWQHNEKAHYRAMFEAEAAQRKSEERYRNTLDGMMEGCQIIDFEWRFLYMNNIATRYSNHTKEQLIGHKLMEVFPGFERFDVFTAYERCMKERTSQHITSRLDDLNGDKRWYEVSIQPIPEGIFVLVFDITQNKLAEDSVRESEARYRSLFEHMTQGAFRQLADGKIINVNPAALRMFGVSREIFLSRTWDSPEWDFIREDNSPLKADEQPAVIALQTGAPAGTVAGVLNHQTQRRVWMEISAIPEFPESGSKPDQVLTTLHDITDRKLAQAENDRLVSAIDQTGEIVVITDTNGIVQYVNPAFESVTRYSKEEVVGKPASIIKTDTQDDAFYQHLWKTIASGNRWRGRFINQKKDGTLYTEEASVSPVYNANGIMVNHVAVKRDITEYLALQNEKDKLQAQFLQSQKMESIGRLAGGVAHDFNNMLNVIIGHSQLSLESIDLNNPLNSHLLEINKAAVRSADLTRQLLAFARKQTIAPESLDLNEKISGLLNMLKRLIGEDIELSWTPGNQLWKTLIDPSQIDQILANLAVNARDAIDKTGRITIETENVCFDDTYCTHHPGFNAGEYVMLVLSDNGCGMEKSVLDHLFEPFFTTKKVGEGTGLGLATVYGIVKQNNGFIYVYSEPGKGSSFKIYFLRHADPNPVKIKEPAAAAPRGGTETVLVVEDEPVLKDLAKTMLERAGYTVIAASTPSKALRIVEEHGEKIDLLIADVVMPEMTGLDLSKMLIALRPDLKVLFMSGYTANIIAHHGVLDEGVHFLQKPFSAKMLAVKVRETLES